MKAANISIAEVSGIPAPLLSDSSDGSSRREAWRHFLSGSLQPLVKRIEKELNNGLEMRDSITISLDGLMQSDIASRARAFKALVSGGMTTDKAAAISGLLVED